jgi:hypothetical protein
LYRYVSGISVAASSSTDKYWLLLNEPAELRCIVSLPVVVQPHLPIPLPPGEAVGLRVAAVVLGDAEGAVAVLADRVASRLAHGDDAAQDIGMVKAGAVGAQFGQGLVNAGAVGVTGALPAGVGVGQQDILLVVEVPGDSGRAVRVGLGRAIAIRTVPAEHPLLGAPPQGVVLKGHLGRGVTTRISRSSAS